MVVVDTNVLAYLLIAGDKTALAQQLFDQDADWHSEPFALVELSNVLATACRTMGLSPGRARRTLERAEELLENTLHPIDHGLALALANDYSVSAYDARFLAVADQLDAPLVTEDKRLRRAAPNLTAALAELVTGH